MSERNILIFNRVNSLFDQGKSKRRAYLEVSIEESSNLPPGKKPLSANAIEKICDAISRAIKP
jgi:hypothetical protein